MSWLLWERHQTLSEITGALDRLVGVLDRTISLAQAKGPLEFQAIQAMGMQYPVSETGVYDPSDEAEARRLGEVDDTPTRVRDELNGYESDARDFVTELDERI